MHQPILQGPSASAQITLGFAPVLTIGCWASLGNLTSGSVSASVRLEPYITQGLSVHTLGPFQTPPPIDLKSVPSTNGLCNQGHDTRLNLQTGVLPLRLTAQYHLASDITATFTSDGQPWHSDAMWGPWLMKWVEKPPVTLMYNCYCLSCPVPTPVSTASSAN
ncbi:hypothetical protein KFL_006800045 [Klebsormidium nitens]|uniref:Uncharacterized protein n=1 Tax=Klebsormidium nitens TaxID=105231 RepID=A0A1Y1IMS5_KLENI|nr:hypothetical protein KFL_006800045 [Klebsormidium nitens]|eukprot:GAQ90749.1 hypothetical protein KFL_006800045 [Klebsormidium nitens]